MSETLHDYEDFIGPNPRVVALDYLGGEGGYCEPLIVDAEDKQHYLLHQAYLSSAGRKPGDYVLVHRSISYETREALEMAFGEVQRLLCIPRTFEGWVETNATLGFDIPSKEFSDATTRIFMIPYDQRPLTRSS